MKRSLIISFILLEIVLGYKCFGFPNVMQVSINNILASTATVSDVQKYHGEFWDPEHRTETKDPIKGQKIISGTGKIFTLKKKGAYGPNIAVTLDYPDLGKHQQYRLHTSVNYSYVNNPKNKKHYVSIGFKYLGEDSGEPQAVVCGFSSLPTHKPDNGKRGGITANVQINCYPNA